MIVDANDPLFDPTFKPCRDDRCAVEPLHREHRIRSQRGRQCKNCPVCRSPIVREPRKWARCSSPTCSWRIVNHKPEKEHARDQP